MAWLVALILALFSGPFSSPPDPMEVHQVASLMDILRSVGFSGNGLRIAYAVAIAESSGNSRAHNPNAGTGDNSYGLFQINMLGDMGPERRRQYGLSSNEDLYDPYVNARVAYKMSNGGTKWRDWSTYNDGSYTRYLGGSDIQVSSSGSGGTVNDKNTGSTYKPPPSRGETAESYGFVEALMNSNSELKSLFDKAVSEQWTPQKFQASLRDTNWWKTHPDSERQFLTAQYGDPATAKEKMDQAWIHIRQLANKIGIVETDGNNYQKFNEWAYKAVAFGWNDDRLRAEMARFVSFGETGQQWEGEAGEIMQKLHTYAWQMGVTMDKSWYEQVTRNAVSGENQLQDYLDEIRRQSKSLYSTWTDQIDAGQLVSDLASPYMNSMAQILEIPPGSINLFDPTIKKALQYKDPQSGQSQVMQIWQFENSLREDDRWKKTKNAQDSMFQVAHQVLSDFGVKY